jgi:sugar transferase EpsL
LSGKRLFDVVAASLGLVATAPIIAAIAALVRWRLGSPVLFRQERPGLHGRLFQMLKFRTMTDVRGRDGKLLADVERLSPFGKTLRSSSLDELPELWNVLRGDMSLVGPRPLLAEYLPLYTPRQARRHEVRPGITGWAQVNGRNAPDWGDRLEMDVWYVENRSMLLDLRILLRTVRSVVRREGINPEGHVTAPRFRGTAARDVQDG